MRCHRFFILTIGLFATLAGSALAGNELRFWHLKITDGLSGRGVNSIIRDSKGFMWIATDHGLNRYDSHSFVRFLNNPDDTNSISGNRVNKIIEDKSGTLWLLTDGGLCSFDSQTGKFRRYLVTNNKQTTNAVNDIFEDDDGKFWVGTGNSGWGILEKNTKSYHREQFENQIQHKDALKNVYNINAIASDKNGVMYFGSLSYSLIISEKDQYYFTNHPASFPFPAHTINTIFCDSRNNIWIGAWDNVLHKYNRKYNSLESIFIDGSSKIEFSGNEITCINEDGNGTLWVGTSRAGLFLYNPSDGSVKKFIHNQYNSNSIDENNIRCIFKDPEERMWVGTSGGANIYDPLLNQLEVHYIPDAANEQVNDFLESEDKLFVATSGGLFVVDPETNRSIKKTFVYNGEKLAVTKLFRDNFGTIYAGTNKTVFTLDKNFSIHPFRCCYNRVENSAFDFYNISSSRIVSISQGKFVDKDVIWVSPYGHGVAVFDLNSRSGLVTSLFGDGQFEHLINKIYVDSKKNVFFLTSNHGIARNLDSSQQMDSIFHLPLPDKKSVLISFNPPETNFLNTTIKNLPGSIYDMVENHDGSYWITSPANGLYKLNPDSEVPLIHYENNYSSMFGCHKDEKGNLWIISSSGIECYDSSKNLFYHFGEADGIPEGGVQGYFYKGENGFLYAGGKGYYIKFQPSTMRMNYAIPKIAITHLKIFDKSSDSLLLYPEINLSYKQNYFSFEFAALNYTHSLQSYYSYMLEGFEDKWINAGNRNFAAYTNLNGGRYVFLLRSSNNNSSWSDVVRVPIYIRPPIWKAQWFWPVIALIVGGIVFIIHRNRVIRLHKVQIAKLVAEIDAQEKERHRIARDLHDEFGTKISAFKIYLNTIEKYLGRSRNLEIESTTNELHAVVDESLVDLRNLLMDLSPKLLEMNGFAAAVNELIVRLNKMNMFQITVYIEPALKRFDKKYELILYRIVQELLNNSIKHASCTEISLQLFYREGKLVLNYDDNGKGFDVNERTKNGYGLSNIRMRASLLNGTVTWESKPGHGVNVLAKFPYTFNDIKP